MRPANRRTTSQEIPASSGVQGPGEITTWVGASAAISSPVIRSLRCTSTGTSGAISPRRWTRFQVNES
jgi:hypothetical protein